MCKILWKRLESFFIFFVLFSLVNNSETWAQSTDELLKQMQQQINALQERVTDLESQNTELKEQISNEAANNVSAPPPDVSEDDPHASLFEKPKVQSKYPIEIYGRLDINASYDDSRTNQGNYNLWVLPENQNSGDDQSNISANQSRIGVKMTGPDFYSAHTSGLIEGDFNGGGEENKSHFRLRHALVQLEYPDQELTITAGQTWDIISPLYFPTVNFVVGWWAGNLGYRRPQFRVTKDWHTDNDSIFTVTGGFSRTIGEISGFDPGDTGEDAGFPTLQGRIAYGTPLWMDKPATIGFSGHWGQEEYDTDVFGNNNDFTTWSGNIDLTLPIAEKLNLTSELWIGENLDTYVGGIGQGINAITLNEIGAWGGWTALSMGPFNDVTFNVGASMDDPENGDLPVGGRSRNVSYMANTLWDMTEALQLGFEVSYWQTDYINNDDGDSLRFQTSVKYKF
jgi:hypothetical protein